MPEITDVVALSSIDTSWGNGIRDRAVMRYTDAAARTSSEPTPATGRISWLTGSDRLEVYDGSAWRQFIDTSGGQTIAGALTVSGTLLGKLRNNAGQSFAEFWARNIYFGTGSTPLALQTGDIWFDQGTNQVRFWSGSAWTLAIDAS